MAEQIGIIPIKGTMNNMTFYKSEDGIRVKLQSKVSKEKIKTSDSYERTRENNSEFGTAGRAGKVLRNALASIIGYSKDRRVVSRLLTVMLKAVKADAINPRGKRNVLDGDLELLKGFDFNIKAELAKVLKAPYTAVIDRVAGEMNIQVPPFMPAALLARQPDATHFKLVSAGVELDFEQDVFSTKTFLSNFLPINNADTAPVDIVHQLPANSMHPLFLVLGVQYYVETQGIKYPIKTSEVNALGIVKVSIA